MSRVAVSGWLRRMLVPILSISLLAPSLVLPLAHAQQPATLQGVILDPTGRPAPGFKVVYKDVVTGTEFTSSPSNAAGEYTLQVPVGARYQLTNALAPDGTRLPIQAGAPLPVRAAGVYRRDVQFQVQGAQVTEPATPPVAAPPPPPTSAPQAVTPPAPASQAKAVDDEKKDKKAWWKTPGGVIGIILGVGAAAALLSGGGDDDSASPTNP